MLSGMNQILDRVTIANEIKLILNDFQSKCKCITYKKGIYIYGSPGCGKTHFITELLNELDYDVIKYDAGDVRNKSLIDTIACNNISDKNVLHMMNRKIKKIAIVMDEIDGMNNGDKGGITSLIKLIRQKKTKKQKIENVTLNPIICIGNYYTDKKIKELMKVCNVFELKTVTNSQINTILSRSENYPIFSNLSQYDNIISYIQGDLRKVQFVINIVSKSSNLLDMFMAFDNVFKKKFHNDDAKKITQLIINKNIPLSNHHEYMNETERTIVALLYHENIIDPLFSSPDEMEKKYSIYAHMMQNICFADYIDRVTYQNQIWIFNEMTSIIKTFWSNHIYHTQHQHREHSPTEVRFTKVLTKYSTEYNNQIFIYKMAQHLDLDKKDTILFFHEMRNKHGKLYDKIYRSIDVPNISLLDVKRMYRYLDKNSKTIDEEDDDE
jgi:DNA polymerase III delta prime subunit